MKFSRLMMFVASFCLFWSLCSGIVFGFDTNDGAVTVTFSDETPAQGTVILINVLFTNLGTEDLEVQYFGINFDWMESTRFAGLDLSENPIIISAGETHTFSPVTVEIPSDVSVGSHSYFVGLNGFEGQTEVEWDSIPEVIVIQDLWQDTYADLLDEVAQNMTIAENLTYNSPQAQSFLEQAQNSYSAASDYATQQNWEEAISALQSASVYLGQAETEEENYIEPEPEMDLTLIILGISAVAVVVILVAVVMLRRKPKT